MQKDINNQADTKKDSNSKKKAIYDRLGLIQWDEIRSAFLNLDDGTTLERKQLVIAMSMLMLMLMVSTVTVFILWPRTMAPWIMLCLPVGVILIYAFNGLVFKEKDAAISKYCVIAYMILYTLVLFFRTGGLKGIAGLLMVFMAIFTALALRETPRIIAIVLELISFVVSAHFSTTHPELVSVYNDETMMVMSVIILFETACFGAVVVIFQTRIAIDENHKNQLLSEELTQINEELTAQNEEIVTTNNDLIKITDQLNDALTSQKLFTASMNHELRAPLNGIMGCLQMLIGSENLTEPQNEMLGVTYRSANTLLHIINDLLDYAKIEAGEFQIIESDFDLKNVVDETAMLFANLLREKGLGLDLIIAQDTPCLLRSDGTRIQQIIANLVSNAIKYTPAGVVTYKTEVIQNTLKITVSDTGEGISDETMEVLFTPFKRLNEGEHKKIQGTGLGLYVTHSLVKGLGGTIEVSSKLGEGTTFVVCIPVVIVDDTITYGSKRVASYIQNEMDFSSLKMLCVDDSSVNLMVFDKVIGKATGADITTVDSGKAALELLKDNEYDIIFLDHQMPDMDGVETLQNIRKMNITTPAIALTADTGLEKEKMFVEAGFSGFVPKPMKKENVLEVITKTLK